MADPSKADPDPGDANNNDADQTSKESITALARKEFERANYTPPDAVPILIRGLSLRKDEASAALCAKQPSNEQDSGLEAAPNFASAVLGKWLAARLGLNGPKPPASGARSNDEGNGCVVSGVSALLLPGEGTLLLGPSSSGKTTLLRTISDKISGKIPLDSDSLEGTVLLGNTDPSQADQNLTRTTAFVDQSDLTLTPILTVEETVRFARSCAENDDKGELDKSLDAIFRLAGLDHVKSTVVGNADIRGVSGGQKRRVKLLEMAVGIDVRAMFLDEITNGLDAASALSIQKVVRVALETMGLTALTALLQPSTEVFRTFHRLILLTRDGQVAYSGRIEGAVPHFESMGLNKPEEMNEAEFLLRCASSPVDFWDQESRGEIPERISSSAELAESFNDSEAGRALVAEMDRVQAEYSMPDENATVERDEPSKRLAGFAQPTHKQISLLMGRGWKLVVRNPASLLRVVSAMLFGIFVGTLFLHTKSDASGSVVRAGYGECVHCSMILTRGSRENV
eukprot:scaffold70400_cov54-Attheya_sp.AAC.3